jgi:hypothetical protein
MKNVHLLGLLLIGMISSQVSAQPSEAVAKEKMKPFAHWAGHWTGEGSMQMGPGEPSKSTVDEYLEFKLDGAVLQIEGIGKAPDAEKESKIVHNALAILYYDQSTNQYKFNTFLKDGRNAMAWFNILGEGKYQWGFDVPSGKIRYSITIDPVANKWNEVGEFSNDNGTTWMKFFEMNLKKV